MPLVVLLPPRARIAPGGWVVVDLPCHYESKEPSNDERGEGRADGEEESAKHAQHAGQRFAPRGHPLKFHSDC